MVNFVEWTFKIIPPFTLCGADSFGFSLSCAQHQSISYEVHNDYHILNLFLFIVMNQCQTWTIVIN